MLDGVSLRTDKWPLWLLLNPHRAPDIGIPVGLRMYGVAHRVWLCLDMEADAKADL